MTEAMKLTGSSLECIYYMGMQMGMQPVFSDSASGAYEICLTGQLHGIMSVWASGVENALPMVDLADILGDWGLAVDRVSDLFFTSLADGYRQAGAGTDAVLVHKAALQYALRQVFNAGKQDALQMGGS